MNKFIAQIFQSAEGNFSSKRAVTLFSFALLSLAFITNLFWDVTIDHHEFDAMLYIVIAGLGFTTAEPMVKSVSDRIRPDVDSK